ncbi:MAG: T9SS type A sorting domain-containing protein [Cytophagales bacterium]|nr:T9SS type A sorting domain-containing protein [Cytophagales bacterium]
MRKPLRFSLFIMLAMWVLQASAQVSITAPANGATNVSALPTIAATTTSTTNLYETLYFEVSTDPGFNPALAAPNYFRSGLYIKNAVGPATFTYRPPSVLLFSTTYYVRAFSSRYGFSPVVSFVTQANPTAITAPANGSTNVFVAPTIVATSTSTGNASPNVAETIFFEVSASPAFTPQAAPSYFRSGLYYKNFDGPVNFQYRPGQLAFNTTYYTRAYSSKFGYSSVVSFTTRGLQPPRITYPTQGLTNVSQTPIIQAFTNSIENASPAPVERIYIEVSKNINFSTSQGFPNYQRFGDFVRNTDTPETYTFDVPANRALELGQTYYTRAVSNKNGSSPVVSFVVVGTPTIDTTFLTSADGRLVTNGAVVYANRYSYPLTARTANLANAYDWELDPDGDFVTSPAPFRATTATPSLVLQADAVDPTTNYRLVSGQVYYVRVRGRRTTGTPLTGPWSGNRVGDRFIYRYFNALHPATLSSLYPNGVSFTEDDGNIRLFTQNIGNAGAYIFQVDDDPNFGSPYAVPAINPVYGSRNATYPGVVGNVFYATNILSGQPVFEYLGGLTNGRYYVRARALNANQSGYWHTVRDFVVAIPHEPISAINMANNTTEVPTNFAVQVLDDPDYLERSFDLQISADNFATTLVNLSNTYHRGNLPTGFFGVPGLQFNTTYQARVRSYVYNYPTNPTPWTVITFKTQVAPRITISAVPPSPWPTTGPHVYATNLPGVNQFDWQIEKTNAPVSSSSKTTGVSYVNFYGYIQAGGQYRIRVRGNATAQGITGVWSNWATFSVAATASPRVAAAQSGGDNAAGTGAATQVYPNPFAGTTRLYPGAAAARGTLVVSDVTGKIIEQRPLDGAESVELGASWRGGVYLIKVIDESGAVRNVRVLKR